MVRGSSILIRVEPELKRQIEEAARASGLTLSTFVLDAATVAVEKVRKNSRKTAFGGIPGFFRASIEEAKRGGSGGYETAGWQLANSLDSTIAGDLTLAQWQREIGALMKEIDDDDAVWAWFSSKFPKCMGLVPTRRKDQFLAGVRRAYEEERFGV
jgi:hypothetical protein